MVREDGKFDYEDTDVTDADVADTNKTSISDSFFS